MVGSWHYPQTLDCAVNDCHGKILWLITNIHR
jgi:hypothetical protein